MQNLYKKQSKQEKSPYNSDHLEELKSSETNAKNNGFRVSKALIGSYPYAGGFPAYNKNDGKYVNPEGRNPMYAQYAD